MLPIAVNLLPTTPQPAAGVLTLKVLTGDITAFQTGTVLRALVTDVADGRAQLQVNGQPLTVRAQPNLNPGTELAVRVTPSGFEAVVIPATPTPNPNPTTATPGAPPPTTATVVARPAAPSAPPLPAAAVQVVGLAPNPVANPTNVVARPTDGSPLRTTDGTIAPTTSNTPQARAAPPLPPAGPVTPGTTTAPQIELPNPRTTVDPSVAARTPNAPPSAAQQQVLTAILPRPSRQQSAPAPVSTPVVSSPPPAGRGTPVSGPTGSARPVAPPQLSLVEVLPQSRSGMPQVKVDGRPVYVLETSERLAPGTKFVAEVERTPAGVRIRPASVHSPQLTQAVAAALIKQDRPPTIGELLPKLTRELESLAGPTTKATPTGRAIPESSRPAVVAAAKAVQEAVRALMPDSPRPPSATELKALVEDGGQMYEGKLARQSEGGDGPGPRDLKGSLLSLLEAVPTFAQAQLPVSRATVDSIERQQVVNVFSQQAGTPFVLQVPFPDGQQWRTLHLAIEPEPQPEGDSPDQETLNRPFRMLMHVPLSDLGETWIDAGLNGPRLRAILYLDSPTVRERVRGQLPDLQNELQQSGFAEVLLDVRTTADLTDKQRQRGSAMTASVPIGATVIDARA